VSEATSQPVDTKRILQHRAELFAGLALTDGYQELVRELDRKADRMRKAAGIYALSPEGANQRQLDYDRGFIDALKYIPTIIAHSERVLEKLDEQVSEPDDEGSLW
jgi:hypothetical protein